MSITKIGALEHLIDRHKVELFEAEFYLDFYKRELRNPQKVGIQTAKESVDVWQSRIKTLQDHIKLLEDYGKRISNNN